MNCPGFGIIEICTEDFHPSKDGGIYKLKNGESVEVDLREILNEGIEIEDTILFSHGVRWTRGFFELSCVGGD